MTTYRVTAERDDGWWLLRVPDRGTATAAKRLDQAEAMARDLIAASLRVPADSVTVTIERILDHDMAERIAAARSAREHARAADAEAAELTRSTVSELTRRGYTVRDAASMLGITYQRVAQLRRETTRA